MCYFEEEPKSKYGWVFPVIILVALAAGIWLAK
jgi:hypothetical protein